MIVLLEWLLILNLALLFAHEVDSGYFREWELLGAGDEGYAGFMAAHVLMGVIAFGAVRFLARGPMFYAFSLAIGLIGLFAFFFHGYHRRRRPEKFATLFSRANLSAVLVLSVLQLGVSALLLAGVGGF